ncbi:unnamed protein product, partial [marine sediment metagenome]
NLTTEQRAQANLLGEELIERARSDRSQLWSADLETNYHFDETENGWRLVEGQESIGFCSRWIELDAVERNEQGEIVENGTIDPAAIRVNSYVQWTQRISRTIHHQTYLTRHLNNQAWIQTDWS